MKRFIAGALGVLFSVVSAAQTIPIIPATGPNGTISRTDLQGTFGTKVDANGGTSIGETLTAPGMIGGTAADFVGISGGAVSASLRNSLASILTTMSDIGPTINVAIAAGVLSFNLPCGLFPVVTSITPVNSLSFHGRGDCTVISARSPTADVFHLVSVQYVTLSDFQIESDVNRTAGAGIYATGTFHVTSERVHYTLGNNGTTKHFNAIKLDGTEDTHIVDAEVRGCNSDGVVITGTSTRAEDTYIRDSNIGFCAGIGVHISWASGVYLTNLDVLNNTGRGIVADPATGYEVDGFRAVAVLSDGNGSDCWAFIGAGPITEVSLTNVWGSTCGTSSTLATGIYVNNPMVNDFSVTSSEFQHNSANGAEFDNGQNIVFNDNSLFMNSRFASGAYDGLYINTGINYMIASGNKGGQGGQAALDGGETNKQNYLIYAPSGASANTLTFIGNQGHSNVAGAVSLPSGSNIINLGNGGT